MNLDSSSEDTSETTDPSIHWHAGSCEDNTSYTNPSSTDDGPAPAISNNSGGSQSSKLPQTEFEKQPYSDNAPLPKSQSDPTSLGKKDK